MMQKPAFFKHFIAWILFAIIWVLAQLPYRLLLLFGKGLGNIFKFVLKSRKKVVAINLDICFASSNPKEKQAIINNHFNELGIMVTQTMKAFLGSTTALEEHASINGAEHIQSCLDKNQGVLLVAGHFTALDIGGKILCKKYPIAGMYREHKHPVTEYIVTKSRLKYAAKMFKRDELRPIIKHLKAGGILWYAPDQDYRRGQSVFVPFFGRQAATITATHQMARLSKCKVLFFHVQRNKQAPFYTLTISPPMENFPTKDPVADTARINQGIEKMVVKNPTEYLWVHKRFKTVPKGANSPY
ncbi:MAG: LpxL/LpxP family Kdo(2)-lipid IV(A) lauroyl/palmitoleoyl acyltransferase [Proteobacteria bacterium]|nr:LpxL/LpxP family Kdo(2)-lipid IV(A) lauroyl/palmitoleoyl acyltransferase [Pseudomonadota bacterium]